MPSAFPNAPRLLKGALVAFPSGSHTPTVIAFQYNPGSVTRKLEAQAVAAAGSQSEIQRVVGAPIETITLEVELDATDKLEEGDQDAVTFGVHPQLALLELLLYPTTADVIAANALLDQGTLEIAPADGPFLLFVWGRRRVLPVRLADFSVTEDAFDAHLNPIHAKVGLSLRVLSYNDLTASQPGFAMFLSHQVTKETLASVGGRVGLDTILGDGATLPGV